MPEGTDQPIVTSQTTAQNEAVETVLGRLEEGEIFVPPYQRDSDEWDKEKKSLFVESVLNRLTVPAFYLAPSENNPDRFEVVDGQQRLTTLQSFFQHGFRLLAEEECTYYGNSVQYAALTYGELHDDWKRAFRRYNLTVVTLPHGMSLDLRLEIFRRINEGGTPLSGQDIRLSYYSESSAVRFVQLAGIYDVSRAGAKRMLENAGADFPWPWGSDQNASNLWRRWWNNTKTVTGQTSSEMFLWYVVARCRNEVDKILANKAHLTKNLSLSFRNSTDEVLDIVCAEFKFEDGDPSAPRLLPNAQTLASDHFPEFQRWWLAMRQKCTTQVQVSRYRAAAILTPGLSACFGSPDQVSDDQWGWIGRFVSGARATAEQIGVDFPESKGRWSGARGQRAQIDAYFQVAAEIAKK